MTSHKPFGTHEKMARPADAGAVEVLGHVLGDAVEIGGHGVTRGAVGRLPHQRRQSPLDVLGPHLPAPVDVEVAADDGDVVAPEPGEFLDGGFGDHGHGASSIRRTNRW